MAHTKAGGSTKLGRDSAAKRLGVKLFDGQKVRPGMVVIRQRGTKHLAGKNIKKGSDDTLLALKSGTVKFRKISKTKFNGRKKKVSEVSVI